MRRAVRAKTKVASLLNAWLALGLAGCTAAGAPKPPPPPILVSVSPSSASVLVSQTQTFIALVQNDTQNKGVTWSLTQSGAPCSPACGAFPSAGANRAIYLAPLNMPSSSQVTVTATSLTDGTISASAQIRITAQASAAISVSIVPASASVVVSQYQQFFAEVQNDTQNKGVTWSLAQSGSACTSACGAIAASSNQNAVYAAPAGVPNPSSVTITATSVADNTQYASATITVAPAISAAGDPNQWVDITKYGARSVLYAPSALANCVSGSNAVTLTNGGGDFTQFENGDSIRLDSCGPPTTMTAPSGVAVSPGMNAGGTPAVYGLSLGTASYSYQVIACDKAGGCSAASAVTSTNLGAAVLGRVTAPISRMSLSNKTMTVTTATPHGFAPYALVYIQYFSTQTPSFEGWYIVSSVPSATTFTFLTPIDSRIAGTPTLDTSGGTAVAFNCNVTTWAAVPNAWKYFIYGRNFGAMELIGVAEPGTTSWQDYGPTMMGNFSFPSFVPRMSPNGALNQYLLTTISSGGGTGSIVVSSAAANTTANVGALMGSDTAILAAFQAGQYRTVSIPEGTFHVAGYLDLHAFGPVYVAQGGTLEAADTVQIPGGIYWIGTEPNNPTQFQESPTPWLLGGAGSYPTLYIGGQTGGTLQFDHVLIGSYSANGTLLMYADSGEAFNFDFVQFMAGGGQPLGYMNRHFIFRTGGFDYNFSNCTFIASEAPLGQVSDIGYSFLPSALFAPNGSTPTGSMHFESSWFVGKSAVELNQSPPNSGGGEPYTLFDDTRTQNDLLPVYISSSYPNSNTWGNSSVSFDGFSPADYPSAMTGNWAANTLSVNLQNLSNVPGGGRPLLVGNPTVLVGQNGGTASSGAPGGGWFATGGSQVGYLLPPPSAAPLLTVSAGGGVSVGSHTYETTWTDAFGNPTTPGPSATVNIVPGMQTVTVTPTTAPDGAVGWQYYRDGAMQGPQSTVCGPFAIGTSQVDTLPYSTCGLSAPLQNNALSSGLGINGEETDQITLTGGGHTSVISGTFTADRTLTVPDVSGTIAVTIASGTIAMPTDAVPSDGCGTIVTAAGAGVLSSDVVRFSNSGPPQANPVDVKIFSWTAANNVNFQYCNVTSASISPPAVTLNWQVQR
jgi:hypothetical protein